MLQFLETGKALYVLTAICLLGVLSRFTARGLYKRLIKETDNMTLTKNRFMRELKQKTENTYRLNQGIHNTQAYLEKQLYGYRFIGLSLNGWTSFASQMTLLCFLAGGAAAFGAYWFLQDYLENSLFNRLSKETGAAINMMEDTARETARSGSSKSIRPISRPERVDRAERVERATATKEPEEAPQPIKRERASRTSRKELAPQQEPDVVNSRRDIDYLKRSLEQIAASREKNRSEGDWVKALTPDEMQLVGDILKEYLA